MRVYKQTTPRKVHSNGKWTYEVVISPTARHVGLYYWCNYWAMWDKVLAVNVDGYKVRVVECDINGVPVGREREHCTGVSPAMFADKPFNITRD